MINMRKDRGRSVGPVLVVLVLGVVRLLLLLHAISDLPASGGGGLGNNARRYHEIATIEGTPYRDEAVEVPPLAVGMFEVLNGATGRDLARAMAPLMFLFEAGTALIMRRVWGSRAAFRYWVVGTPLAYHLYMRIDLASVFLAVLGIALIRRRREFAGAAAVAAGVFVKVWPLALVPLLLSRQRARLTAAIVLALLAGGVGWVAWVGIDGPLQVATLRGATGWEFQTPWGLYLWKIRGMPLRLESGALRVGMVAPQVQLLLLCLWAAIAGWTSWRTRDHPGLADGYGATVTVGSLLLLSTLFSDQFVSWLVPWVAVSGDERASIWTVIAATASAGAVALSGSRLPDETSVVAGLLVVRAVAVLVVTTVAASAIVTRGGSSLGRRRSQVG